MRKLRPTLDLTTRLESIMRDLCCRLDTFTHIDPERVLMCMARARATTTTGVFAKIVPMRFPSGSVWHTLHGQRYALPQIPTPHGDVLYLIYVYLPRFFVQPFERRVLTLVHELYHIAPAFDGTLRRIGSRAHGASRADFNERLQPLVTQYLASRPDEALLTILRDDLGTLSRQATLVGRMLPIPKAIRLPDRPSPV